MKKFFLLTGMMLAVGTAFAQKQWSLQDCIDYALANNITLKKSQLQKESATEDLKGAKAALLPSVSASTNQSLGYQPWKDTGLMTVTNGVVNSNIKKTSYNGNYSVNGQWTVWNGGRNTKTVTLDQLAEQQADLQMQETANSIQERIAQIFSQILYLDENVKVSEQMLETSKKNEERGQEMLNVGKMSKADVAQLTSQRANDEYRISEAQILSEIPALQAVYEQALLSRPELERSRLAIKSSGVSLDIAKAGWMPSVSLTGGVTTSTNSLSDNGWGSQMKTNVNTNVGVGVSVPIYDARSTKTAVNKAKIQQLQAQLDLQDQQKTLYSDIQQYWLNATTNQMKYKASMSSVESAQMSYDLLSEQFRLGLKNIVELLAGKDNLLQAQQNQLQSKYQTIYNKQMLDFYKTGEIK